MTSAIEAPEVLRRKERWRAALARLQPRKISLRAKILLIFTLGSLAIASFLAGATYSFTRSTLLKQRDTSGIQQAYRSAQTANGRLRNSPTAAQSIVTDLAGVGTIGPLIVIDGEPFQGSVKYSFDAVPPELADRVIAGNAPARIISRVGGEPMLVVGIPFSEGLNAAYFEFISLKETDSTLNSLRLSLLFAGFIATLFGVAGGTIAAKRVVRPLTTAAQAAKAIAGGRLDTRLETTDDDDLRLLAQSFNDMAAALQQRVERDARFASDVSHELRSPLMTLAASAEVMHGRRDDMPERAQTALDLLVADVSRFQGLVEDLLEISRFDAGAIRLHQEDLLVAEFVRQAVAVSSQPSTTVSITPRAEGIIIQGDRRRLARVIANLIDNARLHGGGQPEITVCEPEGEPEPLEHVWIIVEDHGAGVPVEERNLVFERFARGAVAGRRSSSDGAGLGLALVDEHVRLHGGLVWVTDRQDGEPGARFVIELPAEEVGG